jgi:hypothetical protein
LWGAVPLLRTMRDEQTKNIKVRFNLCIIEVADLDLDKEVQLPTELNGSLIFKQPIKEDLKIRILHLYKKASIEEPAYF